MKILIKRVIALTLIISAMISCQESTGDLDMIEAQTLNKEEVLSIVESMIVTYPVTGVANNSTTTTINSDFDLEDYAHVTKKPRINFPFDITIDGKVITISNIKLLKKLIKKYIGHKKPRFVFPVSVELEDGSAQEIADKEGLRAYLDSLDEGVKPVFVFPLSVLINGKTIEVSNANELIAIMGKSAKGRRPHLVFPLSVILEDGSSLEMANKEEFKAYLDTLADGVKPVFDFPISVIIHGKTIVINTLEEFDALVKKPKKGKKPDFVFPISVTLTDGSTQEIANNDALIAYYKSLDKGVRPVYVFPLSVIKDGKTIVINSQEELDALCRK